MCLGLDRANLNIRELGQCVPDGPHSDKGGIQRPKAEGVTLGDIHTIIYAVEERREFAIAMERAYISNFDFALSH